MKTGTQEMKEGYKVTGWYYEDNYAVCYTGTNNGKPCYLWFSKNEHNATPDITY